MMGRRGHLFSFLHDRSGAFAVMTALLMPVVLIGCLIALDYANTVIRRDEVQAAADQIGLKIAQLYGEKPDLSVEDLTAQAIKELAELLNVDLEALKSSKVIITDIVIDGVSYKKVRIVASLASVLDGLLGASTGEGGGITVASTAIANVKQPDIPNRFSMFFVIDGSGSMSDAVGTSWPRKSKIEVLQETMPDLLSRLEVTARDSDFIIQSGIVSFNSVTYWRPSNCKVYDFYCVTPPEFVINAHESIVLKNDFDWIRQYIANITPFGSTNLGPAIGVATNSLTRSYDSAKSSEKPQLKMIILSDGANQPASGDTLTIKNCQIAKTLNIDIFAIFFKSARDPTMARGEQVLRACVTSLQHYFSANTASELVAALNMVARRATKVKARLIE